MDKEQFPNGIEGITFRHSIKADEKGPNPALTPEGIELAENKGQTELAKEIKDSDAEVVVMMGVSVFQRTRQTLEALMEGIKKVDDPEIEVIDMDELKAFSSGENGSMSAAKKHIQEKVESAAISGQKVVLELPLHLHGMDGNEILVKDAEQKYGPRLLKETIRVGEGKEIKIPVIKQQFRDVMRRVEEGEGSPAELFIKDYLNAKEKGLDYDGVDPNEAADNILRELYRQAAAAEKYLPGRKVGFVNVTHDYGISLAIAKLLNGGVIDRKAQEVAAKINTGFVDNFHLSCQGGEVKVSLNGQVQEINR